MKASLEFVPVWARGGGVRADARLFNVPFGVEVTAGIRAVGASVGRDATGPRYYAMTCSPLVCFAAGFAAPDSPHWMPTSSSADDREFSLIATGRHAAWKLWMRPSKRLPSRANTLREGWGTWENLAFGPRVQKVIQRDTRPVQIDMPEGSYKGKAMRRVTRTWRTRTPWRYTDAVSVEIEIPSGVPVPAPSRSIFSGGDTLENFFRSDERWIEAARMEFEAHLKALRASVKGWKPRLRVRPASVPAPQDQGLSGLFAGILGGRPLPPGDEEIEWEARDPFTGSWNSLGRLRRSQLPVGCAVDRNYGPIGLLTPFLFTGLGLGTLLAQATEDLHE